jgi:hypothetical protein
MPCHAPGRVPPTVGPIGFDSGEGRLRNAKRFRSDAFSSSRLFIIASARITSCRTHILLGEIRQEFFLGDLSVPIGIGGLEHLIITKSISDILAD